MKNPNKVFTTIGATNHCQDERQQNDFYATDPQAVVSLLNLETFNHNIWEPASGMGHIANVLETSGYSVRRSDIVNYNNDDTEILDFLSCDTPVHNTDIITNPPYKYAQNFVEHSLSLVDDGCKVCMFLKLTFLEGISRKAMFERNPLYRLYVSSKRIHCAKDGDFEFASHSAIAYGWYIWIKGYDGLPTIHWF